MNNTIQMIKHRAWDECEIYLANNIVESVNEIRKYTLETFIIKIECKLFCI